MLTKASLIEWAASWVPDTSPLGVPGQRQRFVNALAAELKDWTPPPAKPVFCKHCPFAEHVHYEEGGKRIAPGCTGFEAE